MEHELSQRLVLARIGISLGKPRWLMLAMLFACRTGLGLQFQALASVSTSLVDQLGFNYAQIGRLIVPVHAARAGSGSF